MTNQSNKGRKKKENHSGKDEESGKESDGDTPTDVQTAENPHSLEVPSSSSSSSPLPPTLQENDAEQGDALSLYEGVGEVEEKACTEEGSYSVDGHQSDGDTLTLETAENPPSLEVPSSSSSSSPLSPTLQENDAKQGDALSLHEEVGEVEKKACMEEGSYSVDGHQSDGDTLTLETAKNPPSLEVPFSSSSSSPLPPTLQENDAEQGEAALHEAVSELMEENSCSFKAE
uniref:Uncharacterized protein n=1 Tax=Chromera velia CCMP2878 TaxID=1169474 RepID=A0A0G4FHQ4_9ALVE|eukprot:Cvel_17067.t1-p1 / transcript=Cvel_17067.t1 / gene=Cvel_17067 / organism=Chromera_velia_CCMP2878 / gene_product=hypothetical protein / transcript_product=hypothetical protein / location=Cvel_scaffold1345:13731-15384(+) / protein_length=229 / sequence_SO=supercontig / SO=protein_coding / is_pseudo=false